MIDWNTWAQQKRRVAHRTDVEGLLSEINAELAVQGDEAKGEALLSLASVLREDFIAGEVPASSMQLSRQIVGVLCLAEGCLLHDPLPAMMTASHIHFDCQDPSIAYPHAVRAVEKAKRRPDMIRQCTGNPIRICIALAKYAEIERVESDFLPQIPSGVVADSTLAAYILRLA